MAARISSSRSASAQLGSRQRSSFGGASAASLGVGSTSSSQRISASASARRSARLGGVIARSWRSAGGSALVKSCRGLSVMSAHLIVRRSLASSGGIVAALIARRIIGGALIGVARVALIGGGSARRGIVALGGARHVARRRRSRRHRRALGENRGAHNQLGGAQRRSINVSSSAGGDIGARSTSCHRRHLARRSYRSAALAAAASRQHRM